MYTAATIEKFMLKKDPATKQPIFTKDSTPIELVTPLISGLLTHLREE